MVILAGINLFCTPDFIVNFALQIYGDVSEWLKEHAWKVCIWETVSRVRISPSPQKSKRPDNSGRLLFIGLKMQLV